MWWIWSLLCEQMGPLSCGQSAVYHVDIWPFSTYMWTVLCKILGGCMIWIMFLYYDYVLCLCSVFVLFGVGFVKKLLIFEKVCDGKFGVWQPVKRLNSPLHIPVPLPLRLWLLKLLSFCFFSAASLHRIVIWRISDWRLLLFFME